MGHKKRITKNKIFGPNITVSNAGKKPFVFYAKNVPKSYNEKFIVKRISENYNTEIEIKVLKGPENRKTNTIRITTNNINNLKIALEEEIKIGFTKHLITLPNTSASLMCLSCGKSGHSKKKCKTKSETWAFCAGNHNREECVSKIPKCLKCDGKHPTISRSCPYIKNKFDRLKRIQKERIENHWNVKVGKNPLRISTCKIFSEAVQKSTIKAVKEIEDQISKWKNKEIRKMQQKKNKKPKIESRMVDAGNQEIKSSQTLLFISWYIPFYMLTIRLLSKTKKLKSKLKYVQKTFGIDSLKNNTPKLKNNERNKNIKR